MIKKLFVAGLLVAINLSIIVFGFSGGAEAASKRPGLYRWPGYGNGRNEYESTLKGYVGLPFSKPARARCVGGRWSSEGVRIVTGALPPGLRFSHSKIEGVPTRAGTWHLSIKFLNVRCAGKIYHPKPHILHITTEGSSAPRRVR